MPGPGRFRIFGSVPAGARDDTDNAPTLADLQTLMDQRSSVPARIAETSWTARYRLHRRSVPRFREGRVFLAGDAAHIHSPAGAQGMNTGIQDAYNLAWKIAAVEHGHAHAGILDSYTAERHPVATRLLRTTDRGFSIAAAQHPLARLVRALQPRLLPHAVARPAFRRLVAGLFSQLRVGYPDSPLNSHDGPMRHGPRPGDRAREVVVGGQRLFTLLRGTHYTVLLFTRDADTSPALALAATLENRYGAAVHTHIVSMRDGAGMLTDSDGSAHKRYSNDTAYVIRPDGHIAYRGTPIQLDLLQADLDRRVAHTDPIPRIGPFQHA
ncbi:FAD binding domain-containing protein [Lentzea atacamensis]|uniref:FAD binding domain-containing protein n=1 Tax=Lentzea atacamensis TaxID=531938 RepID=A0A316IJU0_9PSEU|nr:FAD-dependent monooxygenase [Lentzea atacamensis]PWK87469.1 FAD binding domain-containing protein [Lentzea atacamensis]